MEFRDQEWSNGVGELDGMKCLVRRNESLLKYDRAARPFVLMVSLVYENIDPEGFPTDESELNLADFAEESIADLFAEEFDAWFGMSVTSDGTRDLFFFLPSSVSDEKLEEAINSVEPPLDYDFFITEDAEWVPYELMA